MSVRAGLGSSLRRFCTPVGVVASLFLLLAPAAGGDAPPVSFSLTGTSGTNGWFTSNVTIKWSVVDSGDLVSTSGCPIAESITAEGSSNRQCTAVFTWGTVTSPVVTVKIDKTLPSLPAGAPARAADSNGWYNRAVGITFTATDAVSGIGSCTSGAYGGPDAQSASVPGSCTDNAGNRSLGSFELAYDATAPTATVSASRGPQASGWYTSAVTITFAQAAGDLSGPGTCRSPVAYSGPDSGSASVTGTCTDRAGNQSAAASLAFKYDGTPPQALVSASRAPNAAGWFNAPVTISFAQAAGDVSGSTSCTASSAYAGPDSASASRSGTCTDGAGNTSGPAALSFKYDASPPALPTATPARSPDANGWYNRPVGVTFAAADNGPSGVESCSTPTYGGPDSGSASVSGTCTDRAGNQSAPTSLSFKYDATAPQAVASPSRTANAAGWHNAPL